MIPDSITESGSESESDSEKGGELVRKKQKASLSLSGYQGESEFMVKENERI